MAELTINESVEDNAIDNETVTDAEDGKVNITTESGFTCKVDENALDNMRVIEHLVKLQGAKDKFAQMRSYIAIMEALIGEDGKENLYEFLEKSEGRASTAGFEKVLGEIFKELSPDKKKS